MKLLDRISCGEKENMEEEKTQKSEATRVVVIMMRKKKTLLNQYNFTSIKLIFAFKFLQVS